MKKHHIETEYPFAFWKAGLLLRQSKDRSLIHNMVDLLLVVYYAKEKGLTVSEGELQRAADCFRHIQGLHDAAETQTYLKKIGLELIDFELMLEFQLLYNKLKQSLSSVDVVQEVFAENLHLFEFVELAALSFSSSNEAKDFLHELSKEKPASPDQPLDQSDNLKVETSWVFMDFATRADLPKEAATKIFTGDSPRFVGPVETDGKYWIYHILRPKQAEVNEDVYAICEELIIQNFLKEKKREMFGNSLDQFFKGGT